MFKIFRFCRGKSLKLLLLGAFLIIISSLLELLQPLLLNEVIKVVGVLSKAKATEPFSYLPWIITIDNCWFCFGMLILTMMLFMIFSSVIGIGGYFLNVKSMLILCQNIRNKCYQQILNYSFYEFNKISVPSIIVRMTNDVQMCQQSFNMLVTALVRTPVIIAGGVSISFSINPTYGLVILLITTINILIMSIIGLNVFPLLRRSRTTMDNCSSIVRDNVLGSRFVKSYLLSDNQINEYKFYNSKQMNLSYRSSLWLYPISFIFLFSVRLITTSVLLLSGYMIIINNPLTKTPNDIYGILQILQAIYSSSIVFIYLSINIIRNKPSFNRINELLNTNSSIIQPKNPIPFNQENYDIEFKNVSFKYSQHAKNNILSNISFKLKSGETLGIIGSIGSGKTTLINLIPRLYDVSEGEITIGGINVKNMSSVDIRKNISIASQEQIIFSGDIEYNLKYGNENATSDELISACKASCAWDFIKAKEGKLNAKVEHHGRNFSGGQKQRINLARALLRKAKILILDDTTSALDAITEKNVQQNINKYLEKSTKIISSQKISSVINADKIMVLDNGLISGMGTHEELLKTNAIYRDIYRTQMRSIFNYDE